MKKVNIDNFSVAIKENQLSTGVKLDLQSDEKTIGYSFIWDGSQVADDVKRVADKLGVTAVAIYTTYVSGKCRFSIAFFKRNKVIVTSSDHDVIAQQSEDYLGELTFRNDHSYKCYYSGTHRTSHRGFTCQVDKFDPAEKVHVTFSERSGLYYLREQMIRLLSNS